MEQKQFDEIKAMLAVIYKKLDEVDVKVNNRTKPVLKSANSYLYDLTREAEKALKD